jgi:integrase
MTRKEQEALHARVLDRVRRMTPQEGFRALIEFGVFTKDGELALEYGGPRRHTRKDKLMRNRTRSFERKRLKLVAALALQAFGGMRAAEVSSLEWRAGKA